MSYSELDIEKRMPWKVHERLELVPLAAGDIVADAKLDLCEVDSRLLQADCCRHAEDAAKFNKLAIEALQIARQRIEEAIKALERELYEPDGFKAA